MLWKSIKPIKPTLATNIQTVSKEFLIKTKSIEGSHSPSREFPMAIVRNETADMTGSSRYAPNKSSSKRWQGGTMRSTRYLNNSGLSDVRLIGVAAKINVTESPSKETLTDLVPRMPTEMADSNSQIDMMPPVDDPSPDEATLRSTNAKEALLRTGDFNVTSK
jgi:hypothetical protein